MSRPKGIACRWKGKTLAQYREQKGLPQRGEPALPPPVRLRTVVQHATRPPIPQQSQMPKDVIRAVPYTAEQLLKEKVLLPQLEEMAARCAAAGFKW